MKRTLVLDLEVESDIDAIALMRKIVRSKKNALIIRRANVYEPPQGDTLEWEKVRQSREFYRHVMGSDGVSLGVI